MAALSNLWRKNEAACFTEVRDSLKAAIAAYQEEQAVRGTSALRRTAQSEFHCLQPDVAFLTVQRREGF